MSNSPTSLPASAEPESKNRTQLEEIVPIPILVGIFFILWVVVVLLLRQGWSENMRAVIARREARSGNYESALKYYKVLAKARPDNPSYIGELAHVQSQLKNYDEAIANFKEATKVLLALPAPAEDRGYVRPKAEHYYADIGSALFGAKRYSEAKEYLEKYLQIDRNHGASHYFLAKIYLHENNTERASLHLGAAKDAGISQDLILPVLTELLEKRLPPDLR